LLTELVRWQNVTSSCPGPTVVGEPPVVGGLTGVASAVVVGVVVELDGGVVAEAGVGDEVVVVVGGGLVGLVVVWACAREPRSDSITKVPMPIARAKARCIRPS